MEPKTKYILSNYQQFMNPNEKLTARWLTEDWDGETKQLPSWLRKRIFSSFPTTIMSSPNKIARHILLRILRDHKPEIHYEDS